VSCNIISLSVKSGRLGDWNAQFGPNMVPNDQQGVTFFANENNVKLGFVPILVQKLV
jgi:hypothetical protein